MKSLVFKKISAAILSFAMAASVFAGLGTAQAAGITDTDITVIDDETCGNAGWCALQSSEIVKEGSYSFKATPGWENHDYWMIRRDSLPSALNIAALTENGTKGSYQVSGTEVTVEAVDSDNKTTTTDYTYEFTDDQLILTDTSNSSNTLMLSVLSSDELNKDENTKLASELAVEESQAAIGSLTGTWTDAAGNHYTFAEDGTFACSTVIKGAALTILSFGSALGKVGGWLVTIGIVLFAFSTILGWEYHGEKAFEYLFKSHKYNMIYRIVFSLVVYVGATISLDLVWNFSDIANALMAIPNLICLLALSGEIAKDMKEFQVVIKAEKASK